VDAEKELLAPIPPYPVPPPIFPSIESIFRFEKEESRTRRKEKEDKKNSKRQEKVATVSPTTEQGSSKTSSRKPCDLVAPPDLSKSAPLNLKELRKTTRPIPGEAIEEPEEIIEPEYHYIDLDKPLRKEEILQFITERVLQANEEWKKWMQGSLDYEKQQIKNRISELQSAKEAKEADRLNRANRGDSGHNKNRKPEVSAKKRK
jgi:hypothetical protein